MDRVSYRDPAFKHMITSHIDYIGSETEVRKAWQCIVCIDLHRL